MALTCPGSIRLTAQRVATSTRASLPLRTHFNAYSVFDDRQYTQKRPFASRICHVGYSVAKSPRIELRQGGLPRLPSRPFSSSSACRLIESPSRERQVAFAFDIDGVLKRGETLVPGALKALDMLDGRNERGVRIPYIFITNGGGRSETHRAQALSEQLHRPVSPNQVVQAHTVLQSLVEEFRSKPVLAVGGPEGDAVVREVMEGYGFEQVYTPWQISMWHHAAWPFRKSPPREPGLMQDFSRIKFEAVLVFHDSRDWGRDIQYMCDVLRSPTGTIGIVGNDTHPQPFLAFSHGDLLWGNDFPVSRFGQGAFQIALRSVYEAVSGRPLIATTFGKPERGTYEYANALLLNHAAAIGSTSDASNLHVWMVGDNPASDIQGANRFGWKSALVRTGVYRDVEGPPAHRPTIIADDVEAAVRHALEAEWGAATSV